MQKLFVIVFFCIGHISLLGQSLSWSDTKDLAAEENRTVLLVFSGSDWCRGCILFDQQVLQDTNFQAFASNNLAIYKADFPRKKKNKPAPEVIRQNEKLIQQFNPGGTFPLVLLLDAQEQVLFKSEGKMDKDDFLQSIQGILP